MTEQTNAPKVLDSANLEVLLDADKLKKVRGSLGGDRVALENKPAGTDAEGKEIPAVSAFEQMEAIVVKAMKETDEFYGLPVVLGGNLEEAARIVIATVGQRDRDSKKNGIKAVVVLAQPTVEEFLASESEAAQAFVAKLIEREATDVAFSGIRAAESLSELETVMAGLPLTVDDIVSTNRAGGSIGDSIFNDHWKDFRAGVIATKYPKIAKALPQKPEFIKALRSSSYAKENPATAGLEEKGYIKRIGELFVMAVQALDPDSDTAIVEGWIKERDTLKLDYGVKAVSTEGLEDIVLSLD